MTLLKRHAFFILFALLVLSLGANETKDGYIRMLINEKTGRFALSFLTDQENSTYTQLFYKNSATSFLDININGASYRLGSSSLFSTRVDRENDEPVVIYDSASITVKMSFTPVKTVSSPNANGIRITVKMTNKGEDEPNVGLRMLIDTVLGEGRKNIPFVTENLNIKSELIVESSSEERYWISRGKDVSLMGSIADPFDKNAVKPDYLHFANWKKLSDVPWKAPYHEGRSFNKLPYSIGDSAVAYYWEPAVLGAGMTIVYAVYLTTEDAAWYNYGTNAASLRPTARPAAEEKPPEAVIEPAVTGSEPPADAPAYNIALIENEAKETAIKEGADYNVVILKMLQNTLNRFIAGDISLNEIDLQQIELAIEKYGQNQ